MKRVAELEGQRTAEERRLVPSDGEAALRARVGQLESIVQALESRANLGDRDLEVVRKLNRDLVRENTRLQRESDAQTRPQTDTSPENEGAPH